MYYPERKSSTSNQPATTTNVVALPTAQPEARYNALTASTEPLTTSSAPIAPRPSVKPVYGLCGHVARSENHTCGSWSCIQQYCGW
jgi:hypothetical protein